MAGMELGDIHLDVALGAPLGALGRPERRATLRGRRGTW